MPKRTFQRSPKTIAARKELIALSQIAKATKRRMQEEAKTGDEALIAATICINDIILDMYKESTGQTDFRRIDQWNEAGFKVKKGSSSFRVWGTPKRATNKVDVQDVKTGQEKTIEDEFQFWPMCALFHADQVESISQPQSDAA